MSRSGKTKKREATPDPIYNDVLLNSFMNRAMRDGKKNAIQKEVYDALKLIEQKLKQDPMVVFRQAVENVKPLMEVRSRRLGGAAYQVPMPVRGERKQSLAIRWLVQSAQKRPNKEFHTFADKLSAELIDAFNNTGLAIKKKEDTHRMAEANKAFSHFRW
ncbi:30S ribosomal protein S7 [Candidatus Shapirobacteria bacterium CG03_land_8_20_14_0_80_40_19]|uniref:Small ribosomal subunit protein uS7 n=3 Tax=Candidatus Shapironibacteriota TaxID=1752721 RepID=A0A2M7BBM3_9BACT|nr:MAG: 30S ribosomal protein S7 [Candidatus Shapirobacteria bacterium CG11_big_fil_rev_8_21_14_0_20_40_12]PIV00498.1 MAG: 30S ribosomal protein S7 [Candidatus Shapirobacteria bacterium CG03_land_8_20_14_0_80_40_19]PJC28897.1 MAG: 30S ribosomal protein S7 [Candidatus Shapirobacteria bacterium CG_4_9_14_0_2_um_filter_40_11]